MIRVLVACEESQAVCSRLRALGAEAYSCDLLPCTGGHPEWHLQTDVVPLLSESWDMVIGFPPCTYLTVTGNRWFNVDRYGESAIARYSAQDDGIRLFLAILNANAPFIAVENPVGVMSRVYRKPDQIIQPYLFGDPFEKKTCLWLKGLPHLLATEIVKPEPRKFFKSGKSMPAWYCDLVSLDKVSRSIARSKTFPGIANAMASQWFAYVVSHLPRGVCQVTASGYKQIDLFEVSNG